MRSIATDSAPFLRTLPPRRGGRPVPLGTRKLELALQRPLAATRSWTKTASDHHISPPNGLCPRALRFILHSAHAEVVESLLRRGARGFGFLAAFCDGNPTKGGRPRGFHFDCAFAQRLKSLFRRAGDQKPSSTALRPRRPPLRRAGGAFRHSGLAIRARNILCPRAWGNHFR